MVRTKSAHIRRKLVWGEKRTTTTGVIYKRKRGRFGVGKGKYYRNKKDREAVSKRNLGQTSSIYRLLPGDNRMQEDKTKQLGDEVIKGLAEIPKLDKALSAIKSRIELEITKYNELTEIQKQETVSAMMYSVINELKSLWDLYLGALKDKVKEGKALEITGKGDNVKIEILQETILRKYNEYFLKSLVFATDVLSKINVNIHEMKFGKKMFIGKTNKTVEDFLEGKIIEVKDIKDDTGNKSKDDSAGK